MAPLTSTRRNLAMLGICLGVMLSSLDGIIVNVALPQMSQALGSSSSGAVWIALAYQLAVIASLLPCAAAGESFGYRRVYLWGMAVFLAGSAACALSPSLATLVAARTLQGLGGGAMIGVSLALVRAIHPPAILGRALAIYGLSAGVSLTIGPPLTAAILAVGPWPWLFAINLPVGGVALGLCVWLLPRAAGSGRRFDGLGAVLSAVMFVCLIMAVEALGGMDQLWRPIALAIVALGAGALLVRHQAGRTAPLLPLDLLRDRGFSLPTATSVCTYAAQTGALVALPFLLEHALDRSTVRTGLLLTAWPVMMVIAAPVSGRLADRLPPGALTAIGLAGIAAALLLMSALSPGASDLDVAWRVALGGAGVGLFQAPNNKAMMTAGPAARSGAASGMVAVARVFGMAFGAAIAAMAFGLFRDGGAREALVLCAVLAVAGCIASLLRSRGAGAAG